MNISGINKKLYYKVRCIGDNDGTWIIKISSIQENKVFTSFSMVIWDDEGGKVDGLDITISWWGNLEEIDKIEECTGIDRKAAEIIERRYRKLSSLGKDIMSRGVTENWLRLTGQNGL